MRTCETGKPPAVAPAAAEAVDEHPALAEPPAESGIAQLAINVFPMSGVGMFIRKGRIGFIDGGKRERIGGYKTARCVFLVEIGIVHVAAEIEEDNLGFITGTFGHGGDNLGINVLLSVGGADGLFCRPTAIDAGDADDHIAEPFHISAEDREQVGTEVFCGDGLLCRIRLELALVLA